MMVSLSNVNIAQITFVVRCICSSTATEKTATLTYNANGHGTAPSAVTMKYTTATSASSAITASGYTFKEWNTKDDGTGTSYAAGATVKAANTVPSATTLYAIWYTNVAAPDALTYCKSLTYNGDDQVLVNTAGTGFSWDSTTTTGKNATSYTVKANPASGYAWSDGTRTTKTISCSIGKKNVTVTADNKSMTYGGTAPTYSYTVTGAVGSETAVSGTAT